ncbi:MAG: hypothetical protein HOQ02_10295 [Lysobacter sp.]|nr:hypothetical protein [Lysobacter sp.]
MQHPNLPAWQFVVQALNDFAQTLPPSVRSAFEAHANQHVQHLSTVVLAPPPVPAEAPAGAEMPRAEMQH